jgi:atypical dual specificity phosphatase
MKIKLKIAANFHSKINTKIPPPPSLLEDTPQLAFYHVCEGLYFSNYQSACDTSLLHLHNITHVINCASASCANKNIPGIAYSNALLQDISEFDLIGCLNVLLPQIQELREQKAQVLVHCNAGRSRAPAVIAGYMVTKLQKPLCDSLELLKRLNNRIDINIGFIMQLEMLAKMAK